MDKNKIALSLLYGAISISGFVIAIHYWYHEIYKNNKRTKLK